MHQLNLQNLWLLWQWQTNSHTHTCIHTCTHTHANRRGGLDNTICSGRGVCDCFCRCDTPSADGQEITGDACQCDNFRCPLDGNGQVCSGKIKCGVRFTGSVLPFRIGV